LNYSNVVLVSTRTGQQRIDNGQKNKNCAGLIIVIGLGYTNMDYWRFRDCGKTGLS